MFNPSTKKYIEKIMPNNKVEPKLVIFPASPVSTLFVTFVMLDTLIPALLSQSEIFVIRFS